MNFTKHDFFIELSQYYHYGSSYKQVLPFNNCDMEYEGTIESLDDSYDTYTLALNDVVYISRGPYKNHKSYPSPRALYPIKLFICKNNRLITKQTGLSHFTKYKSLHRMMNDGDVILMPDDLYPNDYDYFKKTLFLIECGHLIYNLNQLAKKFNVKYKLDLDSECVILRRIGNPILIDKIALNNMWKVYENRTSGSYKNPLLGTKTKKIIEINQEKLLMEITDFFGEDMLKNTKIFEYKINQAGNFQQTEVDTISYNELNKIYPYINFKNVSSFHVLGISLKIFEKQKAAQTLLAMGFAAQIIHLEHAESGFYSRPIKSFDISNLEKMLKINSAEFHPYYMIINGKV